MTLQLTGIKGVRLKPSCRNQARLMPRTEGVSSESINQKHAFFARRTHTYMAQGIPRSRRRFPLGEALPLHFGWVELRDYPKCVWGPNVSPHCPPPPGEVDCWLRFVAGRWLLQLCYPCFLTLPSPPGRG